MSSSAKHASLAGASASLCENLILGRAQLSRAVTRKTLEPLAAGAFNLLSQRSGSKSKSAENARPPVQGAPKRVLLSGSHLFLTLAPVQPPFRIIE